MVADMQITQRGVLRAGRFYPAVMRSAARLTYTPAHEALFLGDAGRARARSAMSCSSAAAAGRGLSRAARPRAARAARSISTRRRRSSCSTASSVRAIEFISRNDAHRLIEECMMLANVAVATGTAHAARTGAVSRACAAR